MFSLGSFFFHCSACDCYIAVEYLFLIKIEGFIGKNVTITATHSNEETDEVKKSLQSCIKYVTRITAPKCYQTLTAELTLTTVTAP